jgi:hypothetical protein
MQDKDGEDQKVSSYYVGGWRVRPELLPKLNPIHFSVRSPTGTTASSNLGSANDGMARLGTTADYSAARVASIRTRPSGGNRELEVTRNGIAEASQVYYSDPGRGQATKPLSLCTFPSLH